MNPMILFSFLFGYVEVTIEGYAIEKLINLAKRKGILLLDLSREKSTIIKAKMGVKEFKKIRKLAHQTKCYIKIEKKKRNSFYHSKIQEKESFFSFAFSKYNLHFDTFSIHLEY